MKVIVFLLLCIFLNAETCYALSNSEEEIANEIFSHIAVGQMNEFIETVNREINTDLPTLNREMVIQLMSKGLSNDWYSIFRELLGYLLREISSNIQLMGKLLFVAVLCAMLRNLQNSFEYAGISKLAYGVCYVFLMVISIRAYYNAISLATSTIGNMIGFMEALLPLLISLLTGMGAIATAAMVSPILLFVLATVSVCIKDFILPLMLLTGTLEFANYLSDQYRLTYLSGLLKQISVGALGLILVLFIGIITIQGFAGGITDGVALRTVKYATATFIPVVGKIFSDTVELVMSASLLVKNTVGFFGILIISMLCIFPAIKLLSLVLIAKISGALIQIIGDENMAKALEGMSNNLLLVFGAVLTVALMFFLMIAVMIGASSIPMMIK